MTYGQEHKPPFPEPRNHDEEAQNAFAARDSAERESMTPRPEDEMDLTKLWKPAIAWHPDTRAAMEAWPHGWVFLSWTGTWSTALLPTWYKNACYRAKPAPAPAPVPNLIERVGNEPSSTGREHTLWLALHAAHALIATMSGGDPYLRARYEWFIE